jgi:hypothetical protein
MCWNYIMHHISSEWFNFTSLTLPLWSRWGRFCLGSQWKLVKAARCNICSSTFAQSSRPSALCVNSNIFTSNFNTGRQLRGTGGFDVAYSQTINGTRLYIQRGSPRDIFVTRNTRQLMLFGNYRTRMVPTGTTAPDSSQQPDHINTMQVTQ